MAVPKLHWSSWRKTCFGTGRSKYRLFVFQLQAYILYCSDGSGRSQILLHRHWRRGLWLKQWRGNFFQQPTWAGFGEKFFRPSSEETSAWGCKQSPSSCGCGWRSLSLKPNLLRPYPGAILDDQKRLFNYRLSRARRVSENAFGILGSKFRVYQRRLQILPAHVDKVIKATCLLHNFVIRQRVNCTKAGYKDS